MFELKADLAEPILDVAPGLKILAERHFLSFRGDHGVDVDRTRVFPEAQAHEVVEALAQMRLDRLGILRLREDFQLKEEKAVRGERA